MLERGEAPGIDDAELARRIAVGRSGEAGLAEVELVRRFAPRIRLFGLRREGRLASAAWLSTIGKGALLSAAAVVSIRAALPYAFAGWGHDPRYLKDLKNLALISSSVAGFPPALQWAGRTLLFPIKNFVLWGAGPFFGLTALAALGWSLFAVRRRENRTLLPLTAYVLFVGLYHGLTLVKSIRYFYPAYPALAVLSAAMLARLDRALVGRALRRALPEIDLLIGQTDISRWRVDLDYWVFADGELGQADGQARGPASGLEDDALLATLRFRLTAIDRGLPVSVFPPVR